MLVGHATIAAGSMDHRAVRPEPAFETGFWKDAAARKSWVDVEIRNQLGDTIATGEAMMEFPMP